jgi:hypothetical protein
MANRPSIEFQIRVKADGTSTTALILNATGPYLFTGTGTLSPGFDISSNAPQTAYNLASSDGQTPTATVGLISVTYTWPTAPPAGDVILSGSFSFV